MEALSKDFQFSSVVVSSLIEERFKCISEIGIPNFALTI
jgi:hypothetical protein